MRDEAKEVSPLRFARLLRGMTATDLAATMDCTGAWISRLENGAAEMPEHAIPRFAAALGVPPSWLSVGPIPADAGPLHFRHKKRTPASLRDRVQARALLARMLVQQLEQHFDELYRPVLPDQPVLPGRYGEQRRLDEIERVASQLRRDWNLGDGALPHLVHLIEAQGIWVIELPPEDRCVDAFSFWADGHAFIALNPVPLDGSDILENDYSPRNAYRERASVAHELGHLVLHQELKSQFVGKKEIEAEAHRFGSSFLVPAAQWLASSPRSLDWRDYVEPARRWGVSASLLLRRNLDLGIFDESRYQGAMVRLSSELGSRRSEGLWLPPRAEETPGRLAAHLRQLELQGGVTLADLADRLSIFEADLEVMVGARHDDGPRRVLPFRPAGGRRDRRTT